MAAPAHNERKHALLSASHAARWLNCPPSARLEEKFKETCGFQESSVYAEEGTLAHEFAELRLRWLTNQIDSMGYASSLEKLRSHELYSEEIEEQIEKYTSYVLESFEAAKTIVPDPVLFVEEKLDFSHIVEEGYGTGDSGIIADGTMEVIDLKYGKGVKVEACENPQLKLYALGALRNYEMLYDIHTVKLTIIQPRIDNIASWEISVKDLYKWAFEVVKPIAEKAYVGKGIQKAGEHCKFCLVKAMCNTLAQRNVALAKHEFKDPQLLTEKQVIEIYKQIPMLVDWANSVGEFLFNKALAGEKVEGYKLVEAPSRRRWAKEEDVQAKLKEEGYTEEQFNVVKLKGISDIEKLVGKKNFPAMMEGLIIKPQGNPVLVPETDKRPEYKSLEQAKQDFGNE